MMVKADTLVLRNGQRIQGELVAVRGSVIEFEERRGTAAAGRSVTIVTRSFESSSIRLRTTAPTTAVVAPTRAASAAAQTACASGR